MTWTTALFSAVAVALFTAGCSPPPPTWHVRERLGPAQFGMASGEPISRLIIGATARPVLGLLAEELYIEKIGLPIEDGVASFELEIESADTHRANLSVQSFIGFLNDDDQVAGALGQSAFWRRLEANWTLEEHAEGHTVTIRDDRAANAEGVLNARIFMTSPGQSNLESQRISLPPGANIRLFFGSTPSTGPTRPALRYQAALTCDGRPSRALFGEGRIDTRPGEQWQEARVSIEQGGANCRLTLTVTTLAGAPSTEGNWAYPEILVIERDQPPRTNLLLISLDTLRADHMSGYGYARETTPAIDDRLIGEGTTFLEVFSTYPQTDVSHLSLFTGLYPDAQPTRGRLPPGGPITTLAQNLRAAGYRTDAITENALISGLFGFWRGFDAFTERSVIREKLGPTSFANAEEYLRENRDQQFFLFLHTYQTHDPYDSSPEFADLFRGDNHWANGGPVPYVPDPQHDNVDRYDRTIREADALVNQLLNTLEDNGLDANTLVVLLSDHGESFGEHSLPGHGFAFHDEQLRIPLILRGPGVAADVQIPGSASLTDIAPTILDLLDLPKLPQGQGRSLRAAMSGTPIPDSREVFFSWHQKGAIGARNRDWKSIYSAEETRNYELKTDPFEWHTIKQPRLPESRQRILDEHLRESAHLRDSLGGPSPSGATDAQNIPQRMEDSLRALGYLD